MNEATEPALWEDIAEAYVPSVDDYREYFGEED